MAERFWHYTSAGNRFGPIPEAEFRAMVNDGRVPMDSHVWSDGMPQWAPLSQLIGKRSAAVIEPAGAQAYAPEHFATANPEMGYYNPSAGMPQRAATALLGHSRPRGDTGDWPLDDARVGQFEQSAAIRRKVIGAAQLYRALLFLYVLLDVIVLVGGIFLASGSRISNAGIPIATAAAILTALTVLHGFAWKATTKSQRWAPLTMFLVYLVGCALELFALITVVTGSNSAPGEALAPIFTLLFAIAFASVSWRSFAAIPRYLASPAWCQELLARAKA